MSKNYTKFYTFCIKFLQNVTFRHETERRNRPHLRTSPEVSGRPAKTKNRYQKDSGNNRTKLYG
jgi:hypothetical protein